MVPENEFWRFSLAVYGVPDVARECLVLQDQYGINVNLILFCAWLGAVRRTALSERDIEDLHRALGEWHDRAVQPLRAARRAMKGLTSADAIRDRLKALELEAERIEQSILFDLAARRWPVAGTAGAAEAANGNVEALLNRHRLSPSETLPVLIDAALRLAADTSG